MIDMTLLRRVDPDAAAAIDRELERQRGNIELIASENFVSPAVLAAAGTHLTNKYAEGYPGKRYYGGCMFVDEVETLAINRAKELFGAEHANVQPHSGANANLAAYYALVKPGDTILGMSLSHGGHLTHGSPVNFSGKNYNFVPYYVTKDTETIDYAEIERLAVENKPKLILAGASAYPRTLDFKRFKEIADSVGAFFMVDMAHIAGLVAAGIHPNPVPYADIVTSTTHKTLRGPRGGLILCKKEHAQAVDKAIFPGTQGGPLMHIIAAKAVALLEALRPEFTQYQKKITENAKALSLRLLSNGIDLVSNGTDNHLMLLKLAKYSRTGKEIEAALDECNITVNKNSIPFETLSPMVTSGIRVGTPSVTTRGMGIAEMNIIADMLTEVIKDVNAVGDVKVRVKQLCKNYPLYTGDIL